jgi:hypothetical protein
MGGWSGERRASYVLLETRHTPPDSESDDLIRADFMQKAPAAAVAELRRVVGKHNHLLNDWLAGPAAEGPNFSPEYIAFSFMRMAADGC